MEFPVALRAVVFDSQIYPASGCKQLEFFKDEPAAEGIAELVEIPEAALVRWLLESPSICNLIKKELLFTSATPHFLEVRSPFIDDSNAKPGDIDLLMCEKNCPQLSTVVEFK